MKKIIILSLITLGGLAAFLLYDMNYDIFSYVIDKRMDKVYAMVIVAISIALSTLVFQSITGNRILTPGILGLDSLYILFQLLVVVLLGSLSSLVTNPYFSFFISTILLTGMSLLLYRWIFARSSSVYFMVLVGIVMGTFFTSINGMLQIMISPDVFNMVIDRLFASFTLVNKNLIIISVIINTLIVLVLFKKRHVLDLISLGKDHAINLGLDYDKEVIRLLVLVFILVSVSTALVGPITFLGFFSVNIAKNVMKTHKHVFLMISSCLVAIIVLLFGQFLVEHVFEFGLPISVLISMVGGSYFIGMLLRENKA